MSRVNEIRLLPPPGEVKTAQEILKRKKCPEFRKGMDNRELVGEMRYAGNKGLDGSFLSKRELDDSFLKLLGKVVAYQYSKNAEYLIDVAVYSELLYNNSYYFKADDQSENPEFGRECMMAALECLLNMVRYPDEK